LETLEWWQKYIHLFGNQVGKRLAMSGTAAMACANEWEPSAKRLSVRCQGYAVSVMVLAHTYLFKGEYRNLPLLHIRGHPVKSITRIQVHIHFTPPAFSWLLR
jgi:hypothetical protein